MGNAQMMSDGQESPTLQELTLLIAIKLPNNCQSNNNLRTFQPENRGRFKNSQLQINFTCSYKEKSVSEGEH